MTSTKIKTGAHPTEAELAGFLDRSMPEQERKRLWSHMGTCDECLRAIVSAHDAVALFNKTLNRKNGRTNFMKKINVYLILAVISFALSFVTPRYFLQLLVATLLLGAKWITDSKSTRMLVMIYEAWKKGGGKEAARILERFDSNQKNRL